MRDTSDAWMFGLTLATAAAALVSIAASESLLAIACLVWALTRPRWMMLPRFTAPLAAYMTATVLSLVMSPEPAIGIAAVRKFVLFPMVALAATFVTTARRAKFAYASLVVVATAGSLLAIVQFSVQYTKYMQTGDIRLDPMSMERATGFMGHWITFSGEQLLVWCAAVPAIISLGYVWLIPLSIVSAGIILSFTRSSWLGVVAGFCGVAFALPRKLILLLIIPAILVGLGARNMILHRIELSTQQDFSPDQGRLELLKAGAHMIQNHPWFGVGPQRVSSEFKRYMESKPITDSNTMTALLNSRTVHMENNFVQIAAERGLLCLAAFLWFLIDLFLGLMKLRKHPELPIRLASLSALAALTGFLVSGLFTYNFGDSEVLILFLFIMSVPFGLDVAFKQAQITPQ